MKKKLFILLSFLLAIISAGCTSDDDSNTYISGDVTLDEEIIGEWKLVKSIPEENTFGGIDYFCFYSDGSYTYHHHPESNTYQGKYEIVEHDNWEVPTIDNKHLSTNSYLRLFRNANFYEDFPFVIDGSKMHINFWGYTYTYTAFMFERVK